MVEYTEEQIATCGPLRRRIEREKQRKKVSKPKYIEEKTKEYYSLSNPSLNHPRIYFGGLIYYQIITTTTIIVVKRNFS